VRRSDKELTNRKDIDDVLERARICHLALCRDGVPYVVPLNYGYADNCLYFHSAREGRKIDTLRSNNIVSFTTYVDESLLESDIACSWGTKYRSIIGEGKAYLVDDKAGKEAALRIIMRHYSSRDFTFDPVRVDKIVIIKVEIASITGKRSG
jgi:uncharacterized protein